MAKREQNGVIFRFLNAVERVGNRLPHPITLFFILCVMIVFISAICAALGVSASGDLYNSKSGAVEYTTVYAVSLLNREGIVYMLTSAVSNFTGFAPLGVVLVAMLGVGVAEGSGYVSALLKRTVEMTPKRILTPVVVFLGTMSNVASDAGYVVLVPIGALMFMASGRHPLAGLAAAFAGVSGGFSANLIIGTLDPMLAGISTEAARMIDPEYSVEPTANWFFMMVSTLLITVLGAIVTDFIVEPRLGEYKNADSGGHFTNDLSADERRALTRANLTLILLIAGITALALPKNSFLRNPENGSLVAGSPFMAGIIPIIMLLFFIPAVVYGRSSGEFSSEKEVCAAMGKAMSAMGSFIALAFVSAQFISYFSYTSLGTIIAVNGAALLKDSGLGSIPLILLFILFSALINLLMGSASAKWTILAPVFIPMFMLLGFSPELTQVAFRIGDSCTNIITPLMSHFAMILTFTRRYDENSGIGTLISTMLPYSMAFLVGWSLLLIMWMMLGLPLGPGAKLTV